jgi:hypothetical protein
MPAELVLFYLTVPTNTNYEGSHCAVFSGLLSRVQIFLYLTVTGPTPTVGSFFLNLRDRFSQSQKIVGEFNVGPLY